jgi:hypothetical protein
MASDHVCGGSCNCLSHAGSCLFIGCSGAGLVKSLFDSSSNTSSYLTSSIVRLLFFFEVVPGFDVLFSGALFVFDDHELVSSTSL